LQICRENFSLQRAHKFNLYAVAALHFVRKIIIRKTDIEEFPVGMHSKDPPMLTFNYNKLFLTGKRGLTPLMANILHETRHFVQYNLGLLCDKEVDSLKALISETCDIVENIRAGLMSGTIAQSSDHQQLTTYLSQIDLNNYFATNIILLTRNEFNRLVEFGLLTANGTLTAPFSFGENYPGLPNRLLKRYVFDSVCKANQCFLYSHMLPSPNEVFSLVTRFAEFKNSLARLLPGDSVMTGLAFPENFTIPTSPIGRPLPSINARSSLTLAAKVSKHGDEILLHNIRLVNDPLLALKLFILRFYDHKEVLTHDLNIKVGEKYLTEASTGEEKNIKEIDAWLSQIPPQVSKYLNSKLFQNKFDQHLLVYLMGCIRDGTDRCLDDVTFQPEDYRMANAAIARYASNICVDGSPFTLEDISSAMEAGGHYESYQCFLDLVSKNRTCGCKKQSLENLNPRTGYPVWLSNFGQGIICEIVSRKVSQVITKSMPQYPRIAFGIAVIINSLILRYLVERQNSDLITSLAINLGIASLGEYFKFKKSFNSWWTFAWLLLNWPLTWDKGKNLAAWVGGTASVQGLSRLLGDPLGLYTEDTKPYEHKRYAQNVRHAKQHGNNNQKPTQVVKAVTNTVQENTGWFSGTITFFQSHKKALIAAGTAALATTVAIVTYTMNNETNMNS
jgi:hypothetical protein